MSLSILRAEPAHAEELTRIAFAAKRHWGYPEAWIQEWAPLLTITLDIIASMEVWYAQTNGEVAGFHVLSCASERAALEHLWVLPSHMGRGVGRVLFRHAMQLARARGSRVLQIESDPNAAGFYEKMGALRVGERIGVVAGQPRRLPLLEMRL